jgi:hypothetical protein
MMGPTKKPLDGGVSTHQWALALMRGLMAVPPPLSHAPLHCFVRSSLPSLTGH